MLSASRRPTGTKRSGRSARRRRLGERRLAALGLAGCRRRRGACGRRRRGSPRAGRPGGRRRVTASRAGVDAAAQVGDDLAVDRHAAGRDQGLHGRGASRGRRAPGSGSGAGIAGVSGRHRSAVIVGGASRGSSSAASGSSPAAPTSRRPVAVGVGSRRRPAPSAPARRLGRGEVLLELLVGHLAAELAGERLQLVAVLDARPRAPASPAAVRGPSGRGG